MYKSERLAKSIRTLIEDGSFKPQQKLPSLRDQVQLSGLSLMTVMNAYQELEAQGLIYSKEKSGYFVNNYFSNPTENKHLIVSINTKVEINSLIFKYLKSIQPHYISPLGSAFPSPELVYSKKLTQIMGQLVRQKNHYTQIENLPPGDLSLRNLIAQRYTLQGIPTTPDDIVITSGCLDALNLSLQAVAQSGDYILLQQTVFYGAWQAAERLGLHVITIPEHPQFGIDIDALTHILKTYPIKVCWLMLNSHNPIGFTVNDEIKNKIAQLLSMHEVYLIEDDVYEELYYGHQKPLPMKFFDQKNLILHCSSFSKTLGSSFRIGWVHAGNFSNKIQHLQLMSTISANSILQKALVEFISHHHYEKHLRRLRFNLEKNKKCIFQYLEMYLSECCEIFYYPSGFFIWMKLPNHIDSMKIYNELIQRNIGIAPSQLFSILQTQQHFIRLNCSFEWSDAIHQALDTLIYVIQQNDQFKVIANPNVEV